MVAWQLGELSMIATAAQEGQGHLQDLIDALNQRLDGQELLAKKGSKSKMVIAERASSPHMVRASCPTVKTSGSPLKSSLCRGFKVMKKLEHVWSRTPSGAKQESVFSLIFIDFHSFSFMFIDFHYFS